jgi:hypothetical protein
MNFYRQITNFAVLMHQIVFKVDLTVVDVVSGST